MSAPAPLLTLAVLLAAPAFAQAPLIKYTPKEPDPDDRPVITALHAGLSGSDYAFRLTFDKPPFGETCKNRCANSTVFVDLDSNPKTGLQLGAGAKETGADLALIVQGVREFHEAGSRVRLVSRVRFLPDGARSVEDGSTLQELDHVRDPDRMQVDGNTVRVRADATSAQLPSARRARLVYHPPGEKALEAPAPGLIPGKAPPRKMRPPRKKE